MSMAQGTVGWLGGVELCALSTSGGDHLSQLSEQLSGCGIESLACFGGSMSEVEGRGCGAVVEDTGGVAGSDCSWSISHCVSEY